MISIRGRGQLLAFSRQLSADSPGALAFPAAKIILKVALASIVFELFLLKLIADG
jgi:hypothetical protein